MREMRRCRSRQFGACVMITNVWDHYHSRIVDDNAVVSYWGRTHPDE
jgi:hypothetical protein